MNIHIYQSLKKKIYLNYQHDLLKTLIRQTVFAVSTSETRPILTGVNLKVENNELILYCNR